MDMKKTIALSAIIMLLIPFSYSIGIEASSKISEDSATVNMEANDMPPKPLMNEVKNNGTNKSLEIKNKVKSEIKNMYENQTKNRIKNGTQNGMKMKIEVKEGVIKGPNGEKIEVRKTANNKIQMKVNNVKMETSLKIEQENDNGKVKLKVKLNNGQEKEIKVMPDKASERAIEALKLRNCNEENNCSIELKATGEGNEEQIRYEVKAKKKAKLFGIFSTEMEVEAEVDAETGEVIKAKKPWWAFLASEE